MGYLEGFLVTLRQHRMFGGKRVTTEYSGGAWRRRATAPRTTRRSPSPSACTAATSSTATRTAWRSASAASCAPACARRKCIYVRGADNDPTTRRRPASASASSTRSTTCAASTATCASRPARPRRSPRRSCSSSRFTNRRDAIYTKAELLVDDDGKPQHLPWEDWREGDDARHRGWMRATSPSRRRRLRGRGRWSGELGYGVRAEPAGRRDDPDDERATATLDATHAGRLRSSARSRRWSSAARSASCSGRNPVHCRAQPGADAVRRRRAVRRPGGPLPRRRAGDRLRRRDRRAVPVRDHAARRRPRRGSAGRAVQGAAPGGRRRRRRRRRPRRAWRSLAGAAASAASSPAQQPSARHAQRPPSPTSTSSPATLFTDYVFAFELTSVLLVDRRRRHRSLARPVGRDATERSTARRAAATSVERRRDPGRSPADADLVPRARPPCCSPSARSACSSGATRW